MTSEEFFNEETALQHAMDMLEEGATFEEIGTYLQGKGLSKEIIKQIISKAGQSPLRRQLKNKATFAIIGLLVGLVFYVFALYIQHQQEEQIRALIEQGKGIKGLNDEYILTGGPDKNKYVFLGRIAGFSALFGLFSAFGAFKTWQTLKRLQQP